jgi:hypothetical protein
MLTTLFSALPMNLLMQSPVLFREFLGGAGGGLMDWVDMVLMQVISTITISG